MERYRHTGEEPSNWRLFVNKVTKSEQEKGYAMNEQKDDLTLLNEREGKEQEHTRLIEENRLLKQKVESINKFIKQYMSLDQSTEKPTSPRKEETQFGSGIIIPFRPPKDFRPPKEKEEIIESPKRHAAKGEVDITRITEGKREFINNKLPIFNEPRDEESLKGGEEAAYVSDREDELHPKYPSNEFFNRVRNALDRYFNTVSQEQFEEDVRRAVAPRAPLFDEVKKLRKKKEQSKRSK